MDSIRKNRITVYEHQALKLDMHEDFKIHHLEALQRYYGEKGTNYYSLINKGVKFSQYVGVLQVGKLIVEVLPKTDRDEGIDWRKLLIGMLRAVGTVKIFSTGTTNLRLRSNSVLDLYFELFISEVEQLSHQGLIKQYRQYEENRSSLKGKLHFSKQIQQNLIHKERFYVKNQTYDSNNIFNQIIYAALSLIKKINISPYLSSRIGVILLAFPEMSAIKVNEVTFSRLKFNRKTEPYKEAINIARLILLNYHPDLSNGQNNVLALMFDMNVLWEKFVLLSLKKNAPADFDIRGKIKKTFWENDSKQKVGMEPDIVIEKGEKTYILDTKWKMLRSNRPDDDDLKQMYVYTKYFNSSYTALVYPDDLIVQNNGSFYYEYSDTKYYPCSIIKLKVPENSSNLILWQKEISQEIITQIES